ncbi:serine hydrolase domain-containing protein [Brevundimonas sp.]|uniref:serine hydrolase domain-containing protein n=1 Tax=Brevundimonas sp. TaxID=1871086 RepID=UPI003F6F33BC
MGATAGLGALSLGGLGRAGDSGGSIAARLDAAVEQLIIDADFSGALMLKRGDQILYQRAVGQADRVFGVANRIDTRFNVASLGKMFTATAILRLVEQGRIDLDAPILRYLPDYPVRPIAERVTARQLLSHSSGVGNYWEAIAEKPSQAFVEARDFLPLFAHQPLEFTPGERFGYSNGGYVILGLIVEALTGDAYADHIRRTLFEPLGMSGSGDWPLDLVVPNRADGYTRDEAVPGAWRNNLFVNQFRGNPSGGGYSTVEDLSTFISALGDGRLMSPQMRAMATTGLFDRGRGRYGLGFVEETINGHRMVGNTGGHFGIAGEVWRYEDLDVTFAMLTNGEVDGYWGMNVAVKDILCGPGPATAGYHLGMAMTAAARDDTVAAARALFDARPHGLQPRLVFEVEGAKARHRGNPERADRIMAIAAIVEPPE